MRSVIVNRIGLGVKLARLGLACAFLGNAGVAAAEDVILSRFTWNTTVDQNGAKSLPAAEGDVIRFLDGSELHGELSSIVPGQGVRWRHPDAKNEIGFRPDNIDTIHFANVEAVKRDTNAAGFKPSCQVYLAGGDVFYGNMPSLDDGRLTLNTAFAGESRVPRGSLRSISFLPRDFAVVYDGPLAAKEWQISPTNAWSFRDGVFVGRGSGSLMSEFEVPGSVTVEFDLAWDDVFAFMVNLYFGPQAGGAVINSYFLTLSSSGVDGRRQTAGAVSSLARAEIPGILQKGKCRFAIQCNQKDGTLALFADNQLIKRWADKPGLLMHGLRVLFVDATGRKGVRLSNIRVIGGQDVEPALGSVSSQTNLDSVSLINRDIARGKITAIDDGNLKLLMGERTFTVPLTRVTRIDFAAGTNAPVAPSHDVRAWLTDGGRVSFQVERWDRDKVAARSAVFGDFILQPRSVRELEFNLGRPKNEPSAARSDLRGLDD